MKRILTFAILISVFSCKNSSTTQNPEKELENLKKQRTEISTKIAALEDKLGTGTKKAAKLVSLMDIQATDFTSYLDVQGKVDAGENVVVSPMAQGTLTAIYVHIGQHVGKGQAIAKIDDNVLRQNIAELQVQIDLASNLFTRQKNLWDQKIGTEVQYLNAKSQRDGLINKMASIRTQLSYYTVKAPISGTVDQMDLKVGQAYAAGTAGLRIVNDANLSVKATVSENYAGKINANDPVKIYFPGANDTLSTHITYATKTIDPVTRGFLVEVKLPSKAIYRPNMIAQIKAVDYHKKGVIAIPVNYIQKSESSDYVFISKNNVAKRTNITVGKISDGQAEITSGLNVGDQLITLGVQDVNEGDQITIK